MTLLTVILPVYNAKPFLKGAIESILNQSFKSFELWLVDDGSSDGSVDIIAQYENHPLVKTILHKTNRGKLAIVTELLASISSKYFTVHDADDLSVKDRFEKQISLMELKEYVMTGTSYNSIDVSGNTLSEHIQSDDISEIRKRMVDKAQFHGPTMIIRTDVLEMVGGFYRIMKMGEDIDFSMRIVEKYPAINLTEILYQYRINPDSMTKSSSYDLLGKLIDRKLIFEFAKERKERGKDSLMENNLSQIEIFKLEAKNEFLRNKGKFVEEYVAYLLHYNLIKNALRFCIRMSLQFPLDFGVHRRTLYVIKRMITK